MINFVNFAEAFKEDIGDRDQGPTGMKLNKAMYVSLASLNSILSFGNLWFSTFFSTTTAKASRSVSLSTSFSSLDSRLGCLGQIKLTLAELGRLTG